MGVRPTQLTDLRSGSAVDSWEGHLLFFSMKEEESRLHSGNLVRMSWIHSGERGKGFSLPETS